ncbi:MAG: transaldolase [Acidobacteriota bacterium]|nr:transaldolase [Acidobacteriota bacterium]
MKPTEKIRRQGQSIWLDFISRSLIRSGELKHLVERDHVTGVTSNPTLFERAIDNEYDYDQGINRLLARKPRVTAQELYEQLSVEDVRMAADVLRGVYDRTQGADGFVSIEISPHLAHHTQASIFEALRLWNQVYRPNLMIKLPATVEGIPAIEELLARGVNVNVTLMFSPAHYEAVAAAFLRGIERAQDPSHLASAASIFVSRLDTAVDRALADIGTAEALALRGKIAIANAKMIYARFRELFYGARFAGLRMRGVRVQRVLWASTGNKNPAYSDVRYVEELIGTDTINTVPPTTLQAFQEHGHVRGITLQEGLQEAEVVLRKLAALNIDLETVAQQLQNDGVAAFDASLDKLLSTIQTEYCHMMTA